MHFHQKNEQYRLFQWFLYRIPKICLTNALIQWVWWFILTNIYIFYLITSSNHEISPYFKSGEFHAGLSRPARSANTGEPSSVKWSNRQGNQTYASLTNEVQPMLSELSRSTFYGLKEVYKFFKRSCCPSMYW